MAPNPRYHDDVTNGEKWAMRHLPGYARWYRFMLMWQSSDKLLELVRAEPDWPDFPHTANAASAARREIFVKWIQDQVGDDPELAAKVTPTYPPMAKRMLQDNGSWLQTLTRDDVDLVRTPIDHIESDAVVTTDGTRHHADVLVYATGFRVNDMVSSLKVFGRNGIELHEQWGDRPAAYLGITVPNFPNFFLLYGPGTNLASGGSLIFHSECEVRYIMGCLDALIAADKAAMEPRQDRYDDWYRRCQAELSTTVWAHPGIKHSFYKNADGLVHSLSPWRLVDYWTWTRTPDPDDFIFAGPRARGTTPLAEPGGSVEGDSCAQS